MALSSGRLVTSKISPRAGKGEPDCSKTKLTVQYALRNIARFHFSHLGAWGRMESGNIPEGELDGFKLHWFQTAFKQLYELGYM